MNSYTCSAFCVVDEIEAEDSHSAAVAFADKHELQLSTAISVRAEDEEPVPFTRYYEVRRQGIQPMLRAGVRRGRS